MECPFTNQHGVTPALFIGNARSDVVARLRQHGVRVIVAERVDRGLRLLKEFSVAAVVYDVPALPPILELVTRGVPVILLAAVDADWGSPQVRVLKRETAAATVTEVLSSLARDAAVARKRRRDDPRPTSI